MPRKSHAAALRRTLQNRQNNTTGKHTLMAECMPALIELEHNINRLIYGELLAGHREGFDMLYTLLNIVRERLERDPQEKKDTVSPAAPPSSPAQDAAQPAASAAQPST